MRYGSVEAMRAIFPGSFDPFHIGHFDVMVRASAIFDSVVVALLQNSQKTGRVDKNVRSLIISDAIQHARTTHGRNNIELYVAPEGSSLFEAAWKNEAWTIVRGIRPDDAVYECNIAYANNSISSGQLGTVLLPSSPALSWCSSTIAWEMIKYGKQSEVIPWRDYGFFQNR